MKITVKEVTVADLFNGYEDKGENGVVGYGGKLDIRPAYQREFIYDDKHRDAKSGTKKSTGKGCSGGIDGVIGSHFNSFYYLCLHYK